MPYKRVRRKRKTGIQWSRVLFCIAVVTALVLAICFLVKSCENDEETGPGNSSPSDTTGTETADTQEPIEANNNPDSGTETTGTTQSPVPGASAIGYVQNGTPPWNLKLVNRWNPIDKDYGQPLTSYIGKGQYDSRAVESLSALVAAGKEHNIRAASLFRNFTHQTNLFENTVIGVMGSNPALTRAQAEEIASTDTARPGTSEHQLGLAVDFLFEKYSSLETAYENTEAYKWMMENCAEYGFILRFPKNKKDITGVMFEPWHYRYVGVEPAREIMSRGITLEEYLYERGE